MKKLLIILIVGLVLVLVNGCSLIDKQKCINSGGKWLPSYIGPGGGGGGSCDCSGIGGKTTEMIGNLMGVKCIPIKEAGLICCKDTRRIPFGDSSIHYIPLRKEDCVSDYLEIVEDDLC